MQIIARDRFADLPGYRKMIPACGHFSQEDRPHELAQGVTGMARKAGFLA